jgi:hypothetical protein
LPTRKLTAYVAMLRETLATVQKGVQEGKTLNQLKQERVLDPGKKWNGEFVTADMLIETIDSDLTGKKDEKLVKRN